jgi:flagellar assembly protein FliH
MSDAIKSDAAQADPSQSENNDAMEQSAMARRERKPRVIPKNDLSAYERWELPAVEGSIGGVSVTTAKQLEAIQKQAYDEGFARGQRDGLAQMQQRAQRFEQLLGVLADPFSDLDQQVEQELVQLAAAIARQIFRREIKTEPGTIVAIVREALSQLPVSSRSISVHLHPEDAVLVRSALAVSDDDRHWRVVDDPVLARGDCQVTTENSRIDASVDARLNAIISSILGGERRDDQSGS